MRTANARDLSYILDYAQANEIHYNSWLNENSSFGQMADFASMQNVSPTDLLAYVSEEQDAYEDYLNAHSTIEDMIKYAQVNSGDFAEFVYLSQEAAADSDVEFDRSMDR